MDFQAADEQSLKLAVERLRRRYEALKARRLSLDMSRGKPSPEQLDLANGLLHCLEDRPDVVDGTDCRNYGAFDGIPEAKALFAEYLGVEPAEIIIGGNSSLALMHDTVARAFSHGLPESPQPWCRRARVRALCPSPGYDRHFSISEHFGMEPTVIEMKDDGPDMDAVERLAAEDESVKLIWLTPRHSNPTGITFTDEVVDRLARMPVKAMDFRLIWDDAYTVHHLTDTPVALRNILEACKAAGAPDRVFLYGSTSKVSFGGGGVTFVGGSEKNMGWMRSHLAVQTIGYDKLNMLRHVRFFKDMDGIRAHMRKHAAIIKPKFDTAQTIFNNELGGKNIARWSTPAGGYFMSLDTLDGCAGRVVAKAREAGVVLTKAGATFPRGVDPRDRNIRIAPTYPSLEEVRQAMELVATCVQLVAGEKLLEGIRLTGRSLKKDSP